MSPRGRPRLLQTFPQPRIGSPIPVVSRRPCRSRCVREPSIPPLPSRRARTQHPSTHRRAHRTSGYPQSLSARRGPKSPQVAPPPPVRQLLPARQQQSSTPFPDVVVGQKAEPTTPKVERREFEELEESLSDGHRWRRSWPWREFRPRNSCTVSYLAAQSQKAGRSLKTSLRGTRKQEGANSLRLAARLATHDAAPASSSTILGSRNEFMRWPV